MDQQQQQPPNVQQGASSENLKDLEEAVTLTSASSSNSDLPSFAESEKVTIVRRHSTKTFTGIRFFGRRCTETILQRTNALNVCICYIHLEIKALQAANPAHRPY
ncbi:hypothetical protein EOD39_12201 [Acipenser ruthenus]|uniref:Uncharacterized protein n=1 Tax=Acipenser ruthenus TaxID=7906 RepID=A0A444ULW8_ACIRT|nr:hypothetical protein EOD39_12201 [Acipenser ruthenus]